MIDAHRPGDHRPLGPAIEFRNPFDGRNAQPHDLADELRRITLHVLAQFVITHGVRFHVLAIHMAIANQQVRDSVQQRQVRARLHRKIEVGHHRRLGHARVRDNQRLVRIGIQMLAKDRMIFRDIRADQQNHIGKGEVLIAAGGAIAAERTLVAGNGRRHAQRRIAVIVARAQAELHQLAQRVELFRQELAGADHAHRLASIALLNAAEFPGHRAHRLRP